MATVVGGGSAGTELPDRAMPSPTDTMLEQFRQRHQSADPLGNWRRADRGSKSATAFLAIALKPGVLEELDTVAAHGMASAAEAYSLQLREAVPNPATSPAGAAAARVLGAVAEWRSRHKLFKPRIEILVGRSGPAFSAAEVFRDVWSKVKRGFPQYEPAHAWMCMLAVEELGETGLELVDEPDLLMLGACRFAAWSSSGRRMDVEAASKQQCAAILGRVQSRCCSSEAPVMDVSYTGPLGASWQQALSLALDAGACSTVVNSCLDLVPREGSELWEQAAQRHAFAAVALSPAAIADLDMDTARKVARWASGFATAADARERWAVMPRWPMGTMPVSPRSVAASVRRLATA